jgi:hypothetical protein
MGELQSYRIAEQPRTEAGDAPDGRASPKSGWRVRVELP